MIFRYLILCAALIFVNSQENHISSISDSARTPIKVIEIQPDEYTENEEFPVEQEKVVLKLFYESLCPDCIEFDPTFIKVALKLLQYVDVYTYPYGNAQMTKNDDGTVEVKCQHGVPECYGNKLHACAIDVFADINMYLPYNGCVMARRSNDTAVEKCGKEMKIAPAKIEAIKKCAKGSRGNDLLVHYGEESEKVDFQYVPYVLINDNVWNAEPEDFMKDVCAAFTSPPEPCIKLYSL